MDSQSCRKLRFFRRPLFRRGRSRLLAVLAVSALGGLLPLAALSPRSLFAGIALQPAPRVFRITGPEGSAEMHRILQEVGTLQRAVLNGHIVRRFGQRAGALLLMANATSAGFPSGRAVDKVLHGLFESQLLLIRQREIEQLWERPITVTMLKRSERRFKRYAQSLMPRRSTWSYNPHLAILMEDLGALYTGDRAVEKERVRGARAQRAIGEVLDKLQSEKQPEPRGPMALTTSFRVPNSPVRVTGRYQESRAKIEFQLEPDGDPANAEAGLVEGLTPGNWDVSMKVGA